MPRLLTFRGRAITPARISQAVQRRIAKFLARQNSFHGVFETFEEALAQAPRYKPHGYDDAGSNDWYQTKLERITLDDYPVVFWLREALANSSSVFEVGGHVGVAYYGFSTVLRYPQGLTWTICDVPSITEAGEKLARERGKKNLKFVNTSQSCEGADIVLAAGSLQYLEPSLALMVAAFTHRPSHILVNMTPVSDGEAFVTLQDIGPAFCAYRIFNRTEFVKSLQTIGYRLVTSWEHPRLVRVPRHPERNFDHYSGFYFARERRLRAR